jgi:N-acetylglucosamine-6-phosphate deacetylase
VKIVTLAPELCGAMDVIPAILQRGALVSIGHSNATIDIAEAAIERGASLITHLFNAMSEVIIAF